MRATHIWGRWTSFHGNARLKTNKKAARQPHNHTHASSGRLQGALYPVWGWNQELAWRLQGRGLLSLSGSLCLFLCLPHTSSKTPNSQNSSSINTLVGLKPSLAHVPVCVRHKHSVHSVTSCLPNWGWDQQNAASQNLTGSAGIKTHYQISKLRCCLMWTSDPPTPQI